MNKRYQPISYDDEIGLDEHHPEQNTKSAAIAAAKSYSRVSAVYDHQARRLVWASSDFPTNLINEN
jgi:hypothetical protein